MKTINIEQMLRQNIKDLKPYSSARDEFKDSDNDMIFLDANENPFDNGINRYPDPKQEKLKKKLSKLKGLAIEQIFLGNGSDEVLDLIIRAFCEPNLDQIICLPPTYGMYEVLANINAIKINNIELTEAFQPNTQAILNVASVNTKILFLCSPNNPTANSFDPNEIEKLLLNFKGLVVIDEAYIDFSKNESYTKRLNQFENLIVVQTFSKAYGMAGIRLGICYASTKVIAVLNKIKPPYNVNSLSQVKALEKLNRPKELQDQITKIIDQREYLIKELAKINFIKRVYPSDANFILIKVDDAVKRYKQLLKRRLVSRDRSSLALCQNTLRITVGTKIENKFLLKILKEVK